MLTGFETSRLCNWVRVLTNLRATFAGLASPLRAGARFPEYTGGERAHMTSIVETYSRLAGEYDDPKNVESCWGRITEHSPSLVTIILAFHWATDLDASVDELALVLKPTGEIDMTFVGRHNGREFIRRTTPVFVEYMTPATALFVGDGHGDSLYRPLASRQAAALGCGAEFRARCVQRLGNSDQRLAIRDVGPRSRRRARGRAQVL